MAEMYDYKGYKLLVQGRTPPVSVFDPRFPRDPAIYRTISLDLAMRWVDGYRNGEIWALNTARRT